jgi:hypothetical protein
MGLLSKQSKLHSNSGHNRDNPEGGNTGSYEWNEDGKLAAATITLGCKLDEGVPNPVYFPVMNSLLPAKRPATSTEKHWPQPRSPMSFGHVNRTAKGDSVLYQLQVQLMPQYNQIFLSNGRDPNDPRLIELARKMGSTPVEIWEDREYWGETNACSIFAIDLPTTVSAACSLVGSNVVSICTPQPMKNAS